MQLPTATQQPRWGEQWRSSPVFIVTAMAIALFTGNLSFGEMLIIREPVLI